MREPLRLEAVGGVDGFIQGLAGDESAGEAGWTGHPVPRRERLQRSAAGEQVERRLGRRVQHQCARVVGPISRWSMARA
jgi:hypothetical protein